MKIYSDESSFFLIELKICGYGSRNKMIKNIQFWLDYFLSLEATDDILIRAGKWVWQLQSYSYAK